MNNTEDPKKTVANAASAAKDSVKDAANTTREAVQDAASTAKDSAKDFAHEAQQSAKEAFETTREAASHAYDKAKEGLRDVEKELSPAIDNLTARAQEFCSKGIDFCAESSEKASSIASETSSGWMFSFIVPFSVRVIVSRFSTSPFSQMASS